MTSFQSHAVDLVRGLASCPLTRIGAPLAHWFERRFGEETSAPFESEKARRDVSPAAGFFYSVTGTNTPCMTRSPVRDTLLRQFDMAWRLNAYHLETLTTEDCLWRPAPAGPHLYQGEDGLWRAELPTREDYDLGPASIGWINWHMLYWWSMALDQTWGPGRLSVDDIVWPGDADALRLALSELHDQWRNALENADEPSLNSTNRIRWPFVDRTLADLFAWANVELTKAAAEVGYVRFLKAAAAAK